MTTALPTDVIIQECHDKKWQYPKPIENLDEWVAANDDAFDPRQVHLMYWPDRPYQPGMEILIIDGATTQAPVIARTNPEAKVTATAHSKESLDHAIYLKHKNRLDNLELHLLPVSEIANLNRSFDLAIASGVLQEGGYAEAELGIKALAQVLKPEGVAAFLLNSRHLSATPEVDYHADPDATSMQSSAVTFSVGDCLNLVDGAGLVFQDWLLKSPYYLPALVVGEDELLRVISNLPERQMWSVMEPLRNQSGCHLFTACRPERPAQSYRIDFNVPEALDYVPAWRLNAGLDGRHAVRPGWSMPLDTVYREMAAKIDGTRTIRQMAGAGDLNSVATTLVQEMWRNDFVTVCTGAAIT